LLIKQNTPQNSKLSCSGFHLLKPFSPQWNFTGLTGESHQGKKNQKEVEENSVLYYNEYF